MSTRYRWSMAQSTYLEAEAAPFAYSADKAGRLRPHLAELLSRLDRFARDHRV